MLMGMTFGFSFAYLLISVINFDNYSLYWNAANVFRHHHDSDSDPHSHGQLDWAQGPSQSVSLHDHDELFHKGFDFIYVNLDY